MKTLPYASSSMYVTDTKEQIAYRNELAKNEALAKKIGISPQDLQKMFDLAGEQKKIYSMAKAYSACGYLAEF
ncbi:hypothetical protein PCI56_02495 [Plesiomonas shigelloides subsp. oncorhynchi]|nr:hypothetical protein [Plesiomonas shigelloides]